MPGVQSYVNRRASEQPEPEETAANGAAKPPHPDLGDLKMNTKTHPAANKSETRSKYRQPSQLGQHAALYGADVSSIGDTSTNPSPDAIKREAYDKVNGQVSNNHGEMHADYSEGEFTDGRQLDEEPDEDEYGTLAHFQADMDEAVAQRRQDGLPIIEGDSYPPTTSGPPSPTALDQLNTLPEPRGSMYQPTRQFKAQTASSLKNGQVHRPEAGPEAVTPFKFGANPSLPIHTGSKKQTTAPTFNQHSKTTPSTNAAHRDSAPSMSCLGVPMNGHMAQSDGQGAATTQQRHRVAAPQHTTKQANHVNVQQPQAIPTPAQQSSGNNADEEDEDELDYDGDTLLTMDYAELKAQSFDTDPNNPRPSRKQGQTLASRLQAVSEAPQQKQYDFFLALPLDEWEEAGDWLLERFGEVLHKFKAVRQEKREAARGFEGEIAKRYDAVGKKRKQTEAQLNEMRENGRELLQGTPKRPKTK
ncbi:extracellular mutant protein 11-domain-containing protein [Neohortaea acidophila]|uniref:Extracellular mutant protein 11-domain-containing protein n=1 Tax=Neohortaea acidophila TaxID=245834 RepID=A0A6A6PYM7_9PEZI|nr:extracellular mutant protein 11-domain-containing protein [Neohortaea acidophila]KAF2484861.1 extracellular mutant protein 11-domain-containing protein [Neohortaea acidophila]